MSEKKFNAIMNIMSATMCSVILVLLIPMMKNIYIMAEEMELQFHWWDKASFIMGPIFLISAILCIGYRGIKELKDNSNSN